MAIRKIEISGYYQDTGIVRMNNGHIIDLLQLSVKNELHSIPYGTKIEIIIKYDEIDYLNGTNGIVWATYNYSQADTVKNALYVQNILAEIIESNLVNRKLYKIFILNTENIEKAMDFIWRNDTGLRLKSDWHYQENKENESFNKWLSGL